jgi:hypothetical protein
MLSRLLAMPLLHPATMLAVPTVPIPTMPMVIPTDITGTPMDILMASESASDTAEALDSVAMDSVVDTAVVSVAGTAEVSAVALVEGASVAAHVEAADAANNR